MSTASNPGKVWTGNDIRETFLRFFENKGHRRVRSSSLVPQCDPTLLFTNAGMNQFKDVFLGLEKRDYNRATTAQKCVRAGGKHNDLENVGFTKRHHTFFEMLGNFSFGDYFKKDAIAYAWELVTSPQWFGIDKSKLYTTVFGGAEVSPGTRLGDDEEAFGFWIDQQVPPDRVVPIPGLKDNFWAMGETGPCGPCSEIFYDMGPAASEEGHIDCTFPCECGRYVEIWNLVFMQFNRDASGTLTPLPKPCVDTGMGLERTAAVLQGVISNYDTDLFVPLLKRAAEICRVDYDEESRSENDNGGAASLRVIADHARAATFLISDGVLPDRGDRGYVLRKIIQRALRHAKKLGTDGPVVSELATDVASMMRTAYPELQLELEKIKKAVRGEEERFRQSWSKLQPLMDSELGPLRDRISAVSSIQWEGDNKTESALRDLVDSIGELLTVAASRDVSENEERISPFRTGVAKALVALRKLGITMPILSDVIDKYARHLSSASPEVREKIRASVSEIEQEERKCLYGYGQLERDLAGLAAERSLASDPELLRRQISAIFGGDWGRYAYSELTQTLRENPKLSGQKAFKLYDTYGVPLDVISEMTKDSGIELDIAGFQSELQRQRDRARTSWRGTHKEAASPAYAKIAETFKTEKDFYQCTSAKDVRIDAIIAKNGPVGELKPGETGEVVLDRTPIYAESGGQVSDTGAFYDSSGAQLLADVTGAYYPVAGLVAHKVNVKETLRVGDRISVVADADRRARIMRNHSGTHLVHAALRNILGTHVKQAGSLNAPDRMRFDFSHFAHVDPEELRDIEQQVNDEIRHNTQVDTTVTSLDNALASGALAFFGDKYPDSNVRVVTIPDERAPRGFYSKELCGGTHVHRIGDIGVLKIVGEQSVAAGVRRVEAVTGIGALEHYQQQAQILTKVASQLNVGEDAVLSTVEKLSQTVKQLEKELETQKRKGALSNLDDLAARAQTIKGTKLVSEEVANIDREGLRQLVDSLRQKLGSGVVVLGMPEDDKVVLIAGVTKDLTAKVHAGKLIQALAPKVGGKGGGRPDLAEAGGKDTSALKSALQSVPSLIEPLL